MHEFAACVLGIFSLLQVQRGPEAPAANHVCMWYQRVCQNGSFISVGIDATDNDLAALDVAGGVESVGFIIGPNKRGGPHITDVGLAHFAHLHELQTVIFIHLPEITDAGLASFSGLTQLRELRFEGNHNITDAGLEHLQRLTELRTLTFFGAPITDHGLLYITGAKHLQDLQLGESQITDGGLVTIAHFHELTTLDLKGTQVTDDGLVALKPLANLNWLCLGSSITDVGLRKLMSMKNLQNLYLPPHTSTTPAGRDALTRANPGLKIHLM